MDTLQIGDFARAGKDQFSRVISFIHLDRDLKTEYLQIHADGLQMPLEVSPDHLVFLKNTPVRASQVKVGDMLGERKVTRVKSVKRRGVYAPVTESGDIVVSGVLVSSYAAVLSHTPKVINQHSGAHAFFAIRRWLCALTFDICESETYTDGFPDWLLPIVHVVAMTEQYPTIQACASVVALPFVAAIYLMEQVVLSPFLMGVLFVSWLFVQRKIKIFKLKAL
jgi:hypothetical protein